MGGIDEFTFRNPFLYSLVHSSNISGELTVVTGHTAVIKAKSLFSWTLHSNEERQTLNKCQRKYMLCQTAFGVMEEKQTRKGEMGVE